MLDLRVLLAAVTLCNPSNARALENQLRDWAATGLSLVTSPSFHGHSLILTDTGTRTLVETDRKRLVIIDNLDEPPGHSVRLDFLVPAVSTCCSRLSLLLPVLQSGLDWSGLFRACSRISVLRISALIPLPYISSILRFRSRAGACLTGRSSSPSRVLPFQGP